VEVGHLEHHLKELALRIIRSRKTSPQKKYSPGPRAIRKKEENLEQRDLVVSRRIKENKKKYAVVYKRFFEKGGGEWFESITGEQMDLDRIYYDIEYLSKCIEDALYIESQHKRKKSRSEMHELLDEIIGNNEQKSNSFYRRLLIGLGTPRWANMDKIREIYRERDRLTDVTGEPYHVDHIVPVVSRWVCGLHVENNLRAIPARENHRKVNKFTPGVDF